MRNVNVPCIALDGCLPEYRSDGAAGADLKANIEEPITLAPGERRLIPTGVWMEIPGEFEAQLRPRSGLANRNGVTLLNSPGTIDSDYRGQIQILLINLGDENFLVKRGDRIAQIVISPVTRAVFKNTEKLTESKRGTKGFGSTGV